MDFIGSVYGGNNRLRRHFRPNHIDYSLIRHLGRLSDGYDSNRSRTDDPNQKTLENPMSTPQRRETRHGASTRLENIAQAQLTMLVTMDR